MNPRTCVISYILLIRIKPTVQDCYVMGQVLKMLYTYHKFLLLICGSIQGAPGMLPQGPKHQTLDDNFLRSGAMDFSIGTLPSSKFLFCHDEAKQVIRSLVLHGKDFKVHLDLKLLPLQSLQHPDGWRFHTQPVITFNPGDLEPNHVEDCKSTKSYLLDQVTDRLMAIQHETSPISLASSLM